MSSGILKFEIDKCKGCGLCVAACPAKILKIDVKTVNKKDYHPICCTDMQAFHLDSQKTQYFLHKGVDTWREMVKIVFSTRQIRVLTIRLTV